MTRDDGRNVKMLAELEQACQEIIKFMNENCSPHDMIVIRQGHVELLSGQCGFPTEIPD